MLRTKTICAPIMLLAAACSGGTATSDPVSTTESELSSTTQFYVPPPTDGALKQVSDLLHARSWGDAARVAKLVGEPQAVWFASGSPSDVKTAVQKTVSLARFEHRVPVLVAYNVPFRDCAQYSAGGATDTAAYEAWIDGFASGIGKGQAVIILEPDALGIIPYNTTINGTAEWCQPTITDSSGNTVPAPGASPAQRYAQIGYAIDSIHSQAPQSSVYLDGTHSAWLGVGEAAYRLVHAGVARAQGFFVNVSNYQLTSDNLQYATWISDAIAASVGAPSWAYDANGNFHFDWLPSQYDPATNYTTVNYTAAYAATVTAGIQSFMGSAVATTHFVIDTSRNGQGPLNTAPYAATPYNQPPSVISGLQSGNWCNPAGAGVGLRPTANTGQPLLDAYLWIKIPGQSDGSCDIAGGARAWDYSTYNPWNLAAAAQSNFDPLWGEVDPAAGVWFPEQALQLAQLANPPLF